MSTILRALQRVEGEKDGEAEMGGLREGVVSPGEPLVREGRSRWRIGVGAALAVLLLSFFLWQMLPGEEVTAPSAPPSADVATSPKASPGPAHRPEGAAPPPGEFAAEAAMPPSPVEEVRESLPPPVAAAPPEPRPRVTAPPPPIEVPAPRPVAAPPPSRIEEPAPPKPVAKVPPAPVEPPPPAVELSVQPSPRLAPPPKPSPPARVATLRPPKVIVKKTVWHPTPERRVARIEVEGHKGPLDLHEGDAVGTLVVAEIQPSGVVFLHGGEKLHRQVGKGR